MSSRTSSTTSSAHQTVLESSAPTEKTVSSLGIVQFGFHAKTSYDADEALLQTRSGQFGVKPKERDSDIWKRPPPDFRYIVYDPRPPKRNTVESMRPWEYGTDGTDGTDGTVAGHSQLVKRNKNEGRLPRIFDEKEKEEEIITRFHIDRPFTAKKKFVTQGMHHPGNYINPKLHDFRQYPPLKKLGLEEFQTNYEKDPYNLRFKAERLNHIHGLPNEPPERDMVAGRQMAPPMSAKKQWEARLVLDKETWPLKYAAFTRHRRRHRQPYSAFIERVETQLNSQWCKEQMEKTLQNSS